MKAMASRPYAHQVPGPGALLQQIRSGTATSRSDLARTTGLSRTAVAARLAGLVDAGLVVESGEGASTGGRPPMRLSFNPAAGSVFAAAVGRSRIQVGLCDLSGRALALGTHDQDVADGPDVVLTQVRDMFDELLAQAGVASSSVRGIGVSIPGVVGPDRATALSAPALPGWEGVPVVPFLTRDLDVPVILERDCNAMALAERDGLMTTYDDLVFVKVSTGIGVGLVLDRRLHRGFRGVAGELGHTRVVRPDGRVCRCGSVDCLEAHASGLALVEEMRKRGREVDHVRDVVAKAMEGDGEAVSLIRESGRMVGDLLVGVVNLLNPQAIVVGGDLARTFEPLLAGIRESVYAGAVTLASRDLRILPTTHGELTGVVGAANLVLAQVLSANAVDQLLVR
jgi:predicted NBD/HSP70 family sugar kinase